MKQIEVDDVFKAAKAFKNEIPAIRDHSVRVKFINGFYRLMIEKVNENGNNTGFQMFVPESVV